MGKLDRLKNYATNKFDEIKEDRRKHKEINRKVKEIEKIEYYKELEKQKSLQAISRADAKAKRNSQPRMQRVTSTSRSIVRAMPKLNRNGPDPFGLFGDKPTAAFKQPAQFNESPFVVPRSKKKRRFNNDEYLDNLM